MIRFVAPLFAFASLTQCYASDFLHTDELSAERACGSAYVKVDKHASMPARLRSVGYKYTISEVNWQQSGSDYSLSQIGSSTFDSSSSSDFWCITPGVHYVVEISVPEFNPLADAQISFCGSSAVSPGSSYFFTVHPDGMCETYSGASSGPADIRAQLMRESSVDVAVFSADFSGDMSGVYSSDYSSDYSSVTMAPTDSPTYSPTSAPTSSPTAVPTTAPTSSPTAVPTTAPTIAPTTIYSTFQASNYTKACYSDCTYTGNTKDPSDWEAAEYCAFYASSGCTTAGISGFTCVPECLNDCPDAFCETFSTMNFQCDNANPDESVYRNKTALDDACLDSYAATASTETEIEFDSNVSYDGVNSSYFNNADARDSAIVAMAESIAGVTASDITIKSITDVTTTTRRRRLDTTTSAAVVYNIQTTAEKLGYSSSGASAAYTSMTDQITNSVSSGNFLTKFKSAAAAKSLAVPATMAVPTSGLSYSAPTIVYAVTATPTRAPTPNPTVAPTAKVNSRKNDDDDEGLSGGAIAGIVIGVVVGVVLIAVLVMYMLSHSKNQSVGVGGMAGLVPGAGAGAAPNRSSEVRMTAPATNHQISRPMM
jgi:hypothetical protein